MRFSRWWVMGFLVLAVSLQSGCKSTAMKGTPFYTGEYEKRVGPAEDRVNVWPLLYYRNPALSVLWPIGERTDDHFAIRPLMSVYGLDSSNHVYNYLWPLAQFDRQTGNNRVFPVFWGDDYRAVFPLYWHSGELWTTAGGHDALIPLWWISSQGDHYSAYYPWPIAHSKQDENEKGWYLWPLLGNYTRRDDSFYRFQAWPIFHQGQSAGGKDRWSTMLPLYFSNRGDDRHTFVTPLWSSGSEGNTSWSLLIPLFFQSKDGGDSLFLSLPWSQGSSLHGRKTWQLMLPVFYHRTDGHRRLLATLLGGQSDSENVSRWLIVPLFAFGQRSATVSEWWGGGPMIHSKTSARERSHHVLPLYYFARDSQGSSFFSVPWSSSTRKDGRSWKMLLPVYYQSRDNASDYFITPLWAGGSSKRWNSSWQAFIPLCYLRRSDQGKLLATLAGGYEVDEQGKRWLIYPLLSWGNRSRDRGSFWALAPLVHAEWSPSGKSNHVLPIYYWNSRDDTFLSLLIAKWRTGQAKSVMVPWALSWLTTAPGRSDLWALGPFAHFSWGNRRGSQHLFPVFYSNPRKGTFVSPLVARWGNASSRTTLIPPALSWATRSPDHSDLWMAGPLAHLSWGEKPGARHVFPVYYRNPQSGTMLSPLICRWTESGRKTSLYPPLLSMKSSGGDRSELWSALGLFRNEWTSKGSQSGHLLPLYLYEKSDYFYTLLYGAKQGKEGYTYFLTPLAGKFDGDSSGGWLFPLFSKKRNRLSGGTSGNILWGFYEGDRKRCHSTMFPLWSYSRQGNDGEKELNVERSILLFLHDYEREVKTAKDGTVSDYTRSRVLFRLWHYERLNGDVSVDVLPAITYDRKADGFKKVTFLWRFFRYERDAGGAKKMDLLFIPILRQKGSQPHA